MRAKEFVIETTTSGCIGTVSVPIGEVIKRSNQTNKTKYKNKYTSAWPKGKSNAR